MRFCTFAAVVTKVIGSSLIPTMESCLRGLALSWLAVLMAGLSVSHAFERPLVIYTVNYPLKYFAERIAGNHAKVVFPAPPEVDPAFWTPDLDTILAYQKADLILLNGAGYAKWVGSATLPQRKLVNTSAGFVDQHIRIAEAVSHSHGPGDKHIHGAKAFTTWLDFSLAVSQAEAVKKALARRWPELKNDFERNYEDLAQDLLSLDEQLETSLSGAPRRMFIASHPVYQYFARRYGLDLRSVHWEPDELPHAPQWAELGAMLSGHPATVMIWEGEPNPLSVKELGKRGVSSLVFDPCANMPTDGDWLSVMRGNVDRLTTAVR